MGGGRSDVGACLREKLRSQSAPRKTDRIWELKQNGIYIAYVFLENDLAEFCCAVRNTS